MITDIRHRGTLPWPHRPIRFRYGTASKGRGRTPHPVTQVNCRIRMDRNTGTGETIEIKASKKIAFRAAKELIDAG
jgi:hypothetical protein